MNNARLIPLFAISLLATHVANAQGTWDGGGDPSNLFSVGANWAGDLAPAGNGALVFDGTVNLNPNNDLTLTAADNAITFNAGAGAFTLNGLSIRVGNIVNNSAFAQTINLQARLNGGRNVNVGTAGMIFSVAPQSTGTARLVTKLGTGIMTMRGNTTGGNVSYSVNAGIMRFDTVLGDTTSISTGTILLNTGGTLQLNNAGTVTFTSVTASNGTSVVLNNSGAVNGAVAIGAGASLTGNGTLAGAISLTGGAIAPGASIGTMTLGTLTLDSISTTTMEIDRLAGQNADLIGVTGTLTLAGTLSVLNIGGTLQLGDSFNLLDAGTFAGSFGTLNLPSLDPTLSWDTSALSSQGTIFVAPAVPEPATSALALVGMLALWQVRRRKA